MEQVFTNITQGLSYLWILGGTIAIGFGIYWLFNKQARQKQIAELRRRHEEMAPTDPEYNQVKLLLSAMIADSQMHSVFNHDSSNSSNSSSDSGGSDGGGSGGD